MAKAAKKYLHDLEGCGWTKGLPVAAVAALAAGVEKASADGEEPWTGIPCVTPDIDLFPEASNGGYERLLKEFVALTYGLINVSDIHETHAGEALNLVFNVHGETRHITLKDDDHDFYHALDTFFTSQNSPLRFLGVRHECGGFVLTTEAACDRAMEKGLLPDGSEDEDEDEE